MRETTTKFGKTAKKFETAVAKYGKKRYKTKEKVRGNSNSVWEKLTIVISFANDTLKNQSSLMSSAAKIS